MSNYGSQSDPLAIVERDRLFGALSASDVFTATYERYVNKGGVAVRRLVLTGPEEVDHVAARSAA